MPAEALSQAATARHQRTVERAERALRDLDAEGAAISFQDARAEGRQRLVEMNEPVRLNLIRMIDGLEALDDGR